MKREHASTNFLRLFIFLIGILILGVCVLFVPWIARDAVQYFPPFLIYLILIPMYVSAIPFYYALYETLKLLKYIDNNKAFAERSVMALKSIKMCAIMIVILHLAVLPLLYIIAELDDAPGIILMGLVVPGASMVITVFAAVLQRLLIDALDIKKDNDLTI